MKNRHFTDLDYLFSFLAQAWLSLRENRLRTLMSIFGVAVGIAAVITVSVVSESGKRYIFAELETYGLNTIWLYRLWQQDNPTVAVREGSGINNDDYEIFKQGCCDAVKRYSAVVYMADWQRTLRAGNNFSKSPVEGVDVDYLQLNRDDLVAGRNFRTRDIEGRRAVAIIGADTARKLFGEHQSALGKSFRMDEQKLLVVGVLKYKNRDFLTKIGATQGYNINDRVLMPYTLYQQVLGKKEIHTLQAEALSHDRLDPAINQMTNVLQRNYKGKYTYRADTMREWIDTANDILGSVSLIGLVAASVSLLVGGIGILNIMSTSVIERTREIGVRKALGARQRDILGQFLFESMYIGLIGGVFGMTLGLLAVFSLAWWTGFNLTPTWYVVLGAVLISLVVGVISGLYPAYRAARLVPADALRYE